MLSGNPAAGDTDGAPPPELIGSYWGTMEVFGKSYDMCLVITEDSVVIHSDKRGRTYPLVKYTDKKDGTWLVSCYNAGENKRKPTKHMTVTVNTDADPVTGKVWINFMSNMGFMKFPDCVKGEEYDGRFAK